MITTFEGASLRSTKDKYILHIPKKIMTVDSVDEMQSLYKSNSLYFDLQQIIEDKNKYALVYNIPAEWKILKKIHKCDIVIRLSLLNEILKSDPLKDNVTILHPQNIFYKDMKHFKIMYRGTSQMLKSANMSNLDQYKILCLTILSKYSYETWQKRKIEILKKEKDMFFNRIEHAENTSSLQEIIESWLNEKEAAYFENEEVRIKKIATYNRKRNLVYMLGLIIVMCISLSLVTAVKFSDNTAKVNLEAKYVSREKAYKNLLFGNVSNATEYLEACNFSDTEMLDWYYMSGDYNTLLDIKSDFAPNVIEKLYAEGKPEEILKLDPANKLSYITMEKNIVKGEDSYVIANYPTIQDNEQLTRIVQFFSERNLSEYAEKALLLINDENVKESALQYVKK